MSRSDPSSIFIGRRDGVDDASTTPPFWTANRIVDYPRYEARRGCIECCIMLIRADA